jgi:hypothetical protein
VKLQVWRYNPDCEAYRTNIVLDLSEVELENDDNIVAALADASFPQLQAINYSIQIDAADNVVRIRDLADMLGEGPNIALMFDLRLLDS